MIALRRPLPTLAGLALAMLAAAVSLPVRSQPASLETTKLRISSNDQVLTLTVEVARTTAQRRQGLMNRDELAADAGMLFLYDTPRQPDFGFWMYQTRIPLDIAYIGDDGRIRSILTMEPCQDQGNCPVYPAGVEFSAALEVNQGYFQRHSIKVGDQVQWR